VPRNPKAKVKVTLYQRAPRLITFQAHPLVVSLSKMYRIVFSCGVYSTSGT